MKKRLRIAVGILLLAAVGVTVLQVATREPSYDGKPLSYWIDPQRTNATPEDLCAALAAMGDKAVPVLIKRVRSKPSPTIQLLLTWLPNFPRLARYMQTSSDARDVAVYALGQLGTAAREAIPALEELNAKGKVTSPFLRASVRAALISIRQESLLPYLHKLQDTSDPEWIECSLVMCYLGTNAITAVQNLIAALEITTNQDNTMIRSYACQALRSIHSRPELCVPALTPMLKSPDHQERTMGLLARAGFGSGAKLARAELITCLGDSDPWVRETATNLLKQIDAGGGAKAGVK